MKAVGALAPKYSMARGLPPPIFGVPTLFKSCICHHYWNLIAMAYHSVKATKPSDLR